VLARTVREVESAAERGRVLPSVRTKFQVVALLVREERARVRVDETISHAQRTEVLKRLVADLALNLQVVKDLLGGKW